MDVQVNFIHRKPHILNIIEIEAFQSGQMYGRPVPSTSIPPNWGTCIQLSETIPSTLKMALRNLGNVPVEVMLGGSNVTLKNNCIWRSSEEAASRSVLMLFLYNLSDVL